MSISRHALLAGGRLALALLVAGCAAGRDTQANASPLFLADDSSDPSFEFLGETYRPSEATGLPHSRT
jgi:hypothetical protein